MGIEITDIGEERPGDPETTGAGASPLGRSSGPRRRWTWVLAVATAAVIGGIAVGTSPGGRDATDETSPASEVPATDSAVEEGPVGGETPREDRVLALPEAPPSVPTSNTRPATDLGVDLLVRHPDGHSTAIIDGQRVALDPRLVNAVPDGSGGWLGYEHIGDGSRLVWARRDAAPVTLGDDVTLLAFVVEAGEPVAYTTRQEGSWEDHEGSPFEAPVFSVLERRPLPDGPIEEVGRLQAYEQSWGAMPNDRRFIPAVCYVTCSPHQDFLDRLAGLQYPRPEDGWMEDAVGEDRFVRVEIGGRLDDGADPSRPDLVFEVCPPDVEGCGPQTDANRRAYRADYERWYAGLAEHPEVVRVERHGERVLVRFRTRPGSEGAQRFAGAHRSRAVFGYDTLEGYAEVAIDVVVWDLRTGDQIVRHRMGWSEAWLPHGITALDPTWDEDPGLVYLAGSGIVLDLATGELTAIDLTDHALVIS